MGDSKSESNDRGIYEEDGSECDWDTSEWIMIVNG